MTTKEKIDEIVKSYPESISVAPRGQFETQLKNHLLKSFGLEVKKEKKKKESDEEKK